MYGWLNGVLANVFKSILGFFSRASNGSVSANESLSETGDALSEVWLHPDSDELRAQTAIKEQKLEAGVFRIGRRASDSVAYPDPNPPDLLLFENSPFTVSRIQCEIEIDGGKVILRDMGSRMGTCLGKKRLRSTSRQPSSVVVPKGTHRLILGSRQGPFRFRLVVS